MDLAVVVFVKVDAAEFDLGQPRPVRQCVAVEKIAVQHLGMQHKLAAIALGGPGRQSRANWVFKRRIGCCTACSVAEGVKWPFRYVAAGGPA